MSIFNSYRGGKGGGGGVAELAPLSLHAVPERRFV